MDIIRRYERRVGVSNTSGPAILKGIEMKFFYEDLLSDNEMYSVIMNAIWFPQWPLTGKIDWETLE